MGFHQAFAKANGVQEMDVFAKVNKSLEKIMPLLTPSSVAIGVLAGGISSWLGHLSVRRAAKIARAEARKTRVEIDKLRQQALASLPADKRVKSS